MPVTALQFTTELMTQHTSYAIFDGCSELPSIGRRDNRDITLLILQLIAPNKDEGDSLEL